MIGTAASAEARIVPVAAGLPAGFDALRDDAQRDGFRFVERLADEWASGANRFAGENEALLAAYIGGVLAGIGGITRDPALPGALRMRRFYVRPAFRRLRIGDRLAAALLARPRRPGTPVVVNAGTEAAPAFWEALGFQEDRRDGHTHILQDAATPRPQRTETDMNDGAAWSLEERFWTAGEDHYQAALDPACIMAFPAPAGILSGPSIAGSLAGAPRWSAVEMRDRVVARPHPGLLVLGYRALGSRDGAAPYEAFCTSSYRLTDEGWKLFQHQQTPVG